MNRRARPLAPPCAVRVTAALLTTAALGTAAAGCADGVATSDVPSGNATLRVVEQTDDDAYREDWPLEPEPEALGTVTSSEDGTTVVCAILTGDQVEVLSEQREWALGPGFVSVTVESCP